MNLKISLRFSQIINKISLLNQVNYRVRLCDLASLCKFQTSLIYNIAGLNARTSRFSYSFFAIQIYIRNIGDIALIKRKISFVIYQKEKMMAHSNQLYIIYSYPEVVLIVKAPYSLILNIRSSYFTTF